MTLSRLTTVLVLLCALAAGLAGQGYERVSTRVFSSVPGIHDQFFQLEDGSYVTAFTEQLLDDQGRGIVNFINADRGVDTFGGKVHMWRMPINAISESTDPFIRRFVYDLSGELLDDITINIDVPKQVAGFSAYENIPDVDYRPDSSFYLPVQYTADRANPEFIRDTTFLFHITYDGTVLRKMVLAPELRYAMRLGTVLPDGSYAAYIDSQTMSSQGTFDKYFVRVFPTGEVVFSPKLSFESGRISTATYLGGYKFLHVAQGDRNDPNYYLGYFDLENQEITRRNTIPGGGPFTSIRKILPEAEGGLIIMEATSRAPDGTLRPSQTRITKRDADFNIIFETYLGLSFSTLTGHDLAPTADGGYLMMGLHSGNRPFHAKLDANGKTFPNNVAGSIAIADEDCGITGDTAAYKNWWIRLDPSTPGRDTVYAYTQADGRFDTRIDTGGYTLNVLPPNAYWEHCAPLPFDVVPGVDTVNLYPSVKAVYNCGLLTVGISSGYQIPRCEETRYYATYENRGTTPTEPSLFRVILDPDFTPTSSLPDWDRRDGDTLFYNLPEIPVWESGRIIINGALGCAETLSDVTHCTEVHVFPDSLCTPAGIDWDGSSVEVVGSCVNDTVVFDIVNTTNNPMTGTIDYVIVEDLIILLGGRVQLEANERISLPLQTDGSGGTYTLITEQRPGHPGDSQPIASVEACGALPGSAYSTGFLGQYPRDDGDPFVSIDCAQNDGAEPPGLRGETAGENKNAGVTDTPLRLDVSPTGIGPERLVDTSTVLKYFLSYTNDSDTTVKRILILDTLPNTLDVGSVVPGPGSLPYGFEVTPFGVLRFELKGIDLAPGKGGFVQFSVAPSAGIAPGTIIRNRAGITYQARAFRVSNTTELKVRKPVRYGVVEVEECYFDLNDAPGVLRRLDTLATAAFDSVTLTVNRSLPAYKIDIDTAIVSGDSLLGVEITMAIQFIERSTTAAGCDSIVFYNVMLAIPDATDDFETEGFVLYPNPARDYAILRTPQGFRAGDVRITDMLGRRYGVSATSGTGDGLLIDLRRLPAGTYALTVADGARRWRGRLVVRR